MTIRAGIICRNCGKVMAMLDEVIAGREVDRIDRYGRAIYHETCQRCEQIISQNRTIWQAIGGEK